MKEIKTYREGQKEFVREEYTNDDGKWHREDGPALVGEKLEAWYINGVLHRLDGPAISCDGYKVWVIEGQVQRVEYISGRIYEKI